MPKRIAQAEHAFHKSLDIMSDRMGVKVHHATLILETDQGRIAFYKKDTIANFQLTVMAFLMDKLNSVFLTQRIGRLITCPDCLGEGERIDDTSLHLRVCGRCNGGGELAVSTDHITLDKMSTEKSDE